MFTLFLWAFSSKLEDLVEIQIFLHAVFVSTLLHLSIQKQTPAIHQNDSLFRNLKLISPLLDQFFQARTDFLKLQAKKFNKHAGFTSFTTINLPFSPRFLLTHTKRTQLLNHLQVRVPNIIKPRKCMFILYHKPYPQSCQLNHGRTKDL